MIIQPNFADADHTRLFRERVELVEAIRSHLGGIVGVDPNGQMEEFGVFAGKVQGVFGGRAIEGGDDDEAKPGINCPLDYGVKIFAEGRHVEVAVCVGENGDVFVGHGFILPVTIALGGGCKSG